VVALKKKRALNHRTWS